MPMLVAIPSNNPGGLEARMSDHFGHCDVFTLVSVEGAEVQEVRIIPNQGHEQGSCLAPVQYLAGHGARILIAGGMGMRPLAGFQDAGIMVLHRGATETVAEAVSAMTEGRLAYFGNENSCGGGSGHCH